MKGVTSLERAQAVPAPFSIAIIMANRPERETSAHVIAMAGAKDRVARLPVGRRSPAPRRE
ncbi:hypothetical protein HS041_26610 [Planomonospora sp. ID67723]|uniref:hypothetical protein n=1 Tax=Planomonospora sp. ID67723 TaxID=2738134 RepID=UPI0018C44326|nr:hypothetical protein [Planomonospora sp. ID67723]MBG0831324.1 hypothetical protein [Planomonospora sp. ID67723]